MMIVEPSFEIPWSLLLRVRVPVSTVSTAPPPIGTFSSFRPSSPARPYRRDTSSAPSNRVVLTYWTRRSVDAVPSGTVSSVL
jgi:hypothetical protein